MAYTPKRKKETKWWEDGIRFECQGSGNCCQSRGAYGYVYLTDEDCIRMADHFEISLKEFKQKFCKKVDGQYCLREDNDHEGNDCRFLSGARCTVYAARPVQCRTWPFWPENMNPKAWRKEVVAFCPGVGKGKKISSEKIRAQLNLMSD